MRFMSEEYQNNLIQVARFSPLFSTDEAPLIQYRTAEKIFCKSFELEDIGRKDASFDARQDDLGIGIKTFVMHNKNKREKIAEFVKDAPLLKDLSGITLAKELSNLRNKRIAKHREQYNISKSIYHLVTRTIKKIRVFECAYNFIDIDSLADRGLSLSDLQDLVWEDEDEDYAEKSSINLVSRAELSEIMNQQDVVLSF